MGTYKQGANGAFSSKAGSIVGMLQICWHYVSDYNAYPSDELIVLLCEHQHRRIWAWPATSATRSDEKFSIDFSQALPGQELHIWLAFKSVEGTYSDSVYAGSVQIPIKHNGHENN